MPWQDLFTLPSLATEDILGAMKKSARLSLKLPPDLDKQLRAAAKEDERSVNWLATKFIEAGLAKRAELSDSRADKLHASNPKP